MCLLFFYWMLTGVKSCLRFIAKNAARQHLESPCFVFPGSTRVLSSCALLSTTSALHMCSLSLLLQISINLYAEQTCWCSSLLFLCVFPYLWVDVPLSDLSADAWWESSVGDVSLTRPRVHSFRRFWGGCDVKVWSEGIAVCFLFSKQPLQGCKSLFILSVNASICGGEEEAILPYISQILAFDFSRSTMM